MGWVSKKRAETAARDSKARANVEEMRKAKRRSEGGDRMNPDLAHQLNLIQKNNGSSKRFF